jgi:O-methyltransferase involved in polyketide biosynthesis
MKKDLDTSRPHTGRVYDYLLGGTYNFEADRKAAEAMLKHVPHARGMAQLNRWFLQLVADKWAEQGFTQVLDLGSGLPTQGHFNERLPNARILFADHDPLNVHYGTELLKDKPNMRYVDADLRDTRAFVDTVGNFFRKDAPLAVGFIGLVYFLDDAALRELGRALYDMAPPGSVMAMTFIAAGDEAGDAELVALYRRLVGVETHLRSVSHVTELLAPWQVTEDRAVEDYLNMTGTVGGNHMIQSRRFWALMAKR